jgi:hypothetical protein
MIESRQCICNKASLFAPNSVLFFLHVAIPLASVSKDMRAGAPPRTFLHGLDGSSCHVFFLFWPLWKTFFTNRPLEKHFSYMDLMVERQSGWRRRWVGGTNSPAYLHLKVFSSFFIWWYLWLLFQKTCVRGRHHALSSMDWMDHIAMYFFILTLMGNFFHK